MISDPYFLFSKNNANNGLFEVYIGIFLKLSLNINLIYIIVDNNKEYTIILK